MTVASTIEIKLDAQTAALKKGFADARQSVDKLGAGLSGKVAAGMAKFHVGLMAVKSALGAIQGGINAVLGAMGQMDATQKFADRIGVSADALTVLNFAAEQTGASSETMQMALQRMTRRISEAAQGSGEAVKALQELGLSAEYLATLSPDQQFGAIADAMKNVSGQGDKVRLAMKLFDSEGVALVNTLAAGSDGLNQFGAEAESLGMLLGDQRRGIEVANDAINRMKKAWGALVQQVAIAVAPALAKIADAIASIVGWFNRLFGLSGSGGAAGAMKDFGAATEAAAKKFVPMQKEVAKVTERVKTDAERTADIVDRVKKQMQGRESKPEKAIGAVTRGTVAGFSAVQEANRQRRDEERRHREQVILLSKIHAALSREGLAMVEVDL